MLGELGGRGGVDAVFEWMVWREFSHRIGEGRDLLWKPATYGEQLYLQLYDYFASEIKVDGPNISHSPFARYLENVNALNRIMLSMDLLMRCVSRAREFYKGYPNADPEHYGRELRQNVDLPGELCRDKGFCQLVKVVAEITATKNRKKKSAVERAILADCPGRCFMCGDPYDLTESKAYLVRTWEHLWPLHLGGETSEQNIITACSGCNHTRANRATWSAMSIGAVYHKDRNQPTGDVRLALGLARLISIAAGDDSGPMTLKQAANKGRPMYIRNEAYENRHMTFFELMDRHQKLEKAI